jgi:glycosyltransferase involved in cell wall biosynthesis
VYEVPAVEQRTTDTFMSTQGDVRVAICICTFMRPELLGDLLRGVARLKFGRVAEPEIRIVVVDNDECASAEEVCRSASLPWPTKYVVEPGRGITHARNRALAEAGPVDFIAFIDDDEVPSVEWLDELLWAQSEFAADVVSGPVLPRYSPEVANWVKHGDFFEPPVLATGCMRNVCASNNVLIGSHVFKRLSRFDHAFALSGAEDTNFFLQVRQAGYRIVWSQEAVVFEVVSAKRGTVAWILRREYQTGNGWVFCEAGVDGRLRNRVARFLKACGHVAIGVAKAVGNALFFDRVATVRALQRVSMGAGMLAALVGHRFLAYRNTQAQNIPQLETDKGVAQTPS